LNSLEQIFGARKPVIGMIALPPLLGYPEHPGLRESCERALSDLAALQDGGADGVCIENDCDRPHRLLATPEVIAAFTRISQEVASCARVPVGLQVLLNDWRASLSIAKVIDARFVRLDFFVDKVRINAGIIDPQPEEVLAFQKQIGAESIALFTDIQVKYSELLEPNKTLATSAQQAISRGAAALIVSGSKTGEPPSPADLKESRQAAGTFPILIGSGTNPQNVSALFEYSDGAIVGTSLRNQKGPEGRVEFARVRKLMDVVQRLR